MSFLATADVLDQCTIYPQVMTLTLVWSHANISGWTYSFFEQCVRSCVHYFARSAKAVLQWNNVRSTTHLGCVVKRLADHQHFAARLVAFWLLCKCLLFSFCLRSSTGGDGTAILCAGRNVHFEATLEGILTIMQIQKRTWSDHSSCSSVQGQAEYVFKQ